MMNGQLLLLVICGACAAQELNSTGPNFDSRFILDEPQGRKSNPMIQGPVSFLLANKFNQPKESDLDSNEGRFMGSALQNLVRQQDNRRLQVNVTNTVLRTVFDQPPEVTSKQLQDILKSVDSRLETLVTGQSRSEKRNKCLGMEAASLGISCVALGDTCYCVQQTSSLKFADAVDFCEALGFDGLASFETKKKASVAGTILKVLARTGVWLSGSDVDSIGSFQWKTKTKKSFDYAKWATGEPVQRTEASCVQLTSTGDWITAPCSASAPFVCEIGI